MGQVGEPRHGARVTDRAWLDSLKVGDRVGVIGNGTDSYVGIRRIEAIQKLHFVLSGATTKYRRDSGRSAGDRGSWSWTSLVPTTDSYLMRHLRGEIEIAARSASEEALTAALALLKPATAPVPS